MILLRRIVALAALVATTNACGDVVRQGRSPVVLVIDNLQAAPTGGFGSGAFQGVLFSDVIVNVTKPDPCSPTSPCPTVFSDLGQVTFHLVSKDAALTPTTNNQVTLSRLRVTFRRQDGRNTPGVDVPFGFDAGLTGTVAPTGTTVLSFELVRHVAKEESPLVQLVVNPNKILAVADVTFFGTDLTGNAVTATGSISIEFGNFGDA